LGYFSVLFQVFKKGAPQKNIKNPKILEDKKQKTLHPTLYYVLKDTFGAKNVS